MQNLVALSLMASDKKIFKVFKKKKKKKKKKKSVLLPWQPEFLTESNSFKKFRRRLWQEHLCEISSKSDR